jgi:hypothetical protein
VPRSLGLEVRHDPLPDNPAHALIAGPNTEAISHALASQVALLPAQDLVC